MDNRTKATIEAYDRCAENYAQFSFETILQFQLLQFEGYLEGKKVIDAGCGSGKDCLYLADQGYQVTGIDASEKMIDQASKRVKGCTFKKMALEELSFKDSTFDGIWCSASLIHLPKKDAEKAISQFHRVLKKGGVLYVGVIEGEGEKIIEGKYLNKKKILLTGYAQQEIESMLEEEGFEILRSYIESDDEHPWINTFARKA